jgi:hypothetical protein
MSTHIEKPKAHEVMPEHHSTDKQPATKEEKIDAQMADSFPASDPPSYSGGNHTIGAPDGRESAPPSGDHPAVLEAEKKVKSGDAPKPHTY